MVMDRIQSQTGIMIVTAFICRETQVLNTKMLFSQMGKKDARPILCMLGLMIVARCGS